MYKVYFFLSGVAQPFAGIGSDQALLKQRFSGLGGCIRSTAMAEVEGRAPTGLTGALELWFPEKADALAASGSEIADLVASDVSVPHVVVGMERIVMRAPDFYDTECVKGLYLFSRRPDIDVAEFQRYWWYDHGPIAGKTESALCYAQAHVLPECYDAEKADYDGVTELHWPSREAADAAIVSEQMRVDQGEDAKNFVHLESVNLFLATQDVVIRP